MTKDQPGKTFAEKYISNSASVMIGIDISETVVMYNPAAEEFIGIASGDVIGRPFVELMEKTSDSGESILLNSLRTGRPYSHVEATVESAMGPVNVMAYTTVITDDNNDVTGAVLSIRDITSQKLLEEKVVNDQKLTIIGDIAADIADEIRNPLTSVKGFLQILYKQFSDDQQMRLYIDLMLGEIRKANSMISGLILTSRPMVPIKKSVDINKMLDEVIASGEIKCRLKSVRIKKKLEKSCSPVEVDPEQIKQVFVNLISNALESMPNGGWLEISTSYRSSEGFIETSIADTGYGIESSSLERIFEPFFTTKEGRTGLGLTIAQKILENHGGAIEVKSRKGSPTIFTVKIPVLTNGKIEN